MAKELPYFKFVISEYLNGDIYLEDYRTQGVFINICSYYWHCSCELTIYKLKKKYKDIDTEISILSKEKIIKIKGEKIIINFLDEQWNSKEVLKVINRKNGSLGGRPKNPIESEEEPKNNPLGFKSDSEIKAEENPIETNIDNNIEDNIILDEIREEDTIKDFAFKELKNQLCILLVDFFEFNGNHFNRQRMEISDFVKTQIVDESFYNHFLEQFNNYQQYKDLTKEQKHHFNTYLGTQKEAFEDGQWNKENWGSKLEKAKSNTTSKFDRTKQAYNDATNPYEK